MDMDMDAYKANLLWDQISRLLLQHLHIGVRVSREPLLDGAYAMLTNSDSTFG